MTSRACIVAATVLLAAAGTACSQPQGKPGQVLDEAMRAHVMPADMKAADEDYFHDMDGGVALTPQEVQGRDMWIVWTGGNDRFWDAISNTSLGTFELLKTISSHPSMRYSRDDRFRYLGLVNEPCFKKPTGPDPSRFGLWLDVRDPACPPDPFANAAKYKGVQIGARGKTVPVGSLYGEPTGIVGLRLFPNPDFDESAKKRWDSERYYRDPGYYFDKNVVRPYRIGMSCAFCHVGPNPVKPPANPESPGWENLSSNVGAQYFWVDRIFNWQGEGNSRSFFYQLFHTSRPGALDTSLVSTDNINNPRTMNAVYQFGPRMAQARKWGKETIAGGGLNNKQFNDFVPIGNPLAQFFTPPDLVWTPRVLKDGSDSVGALGALNRVYLNIGLFSEEWLLHFRALVGGRPISPIEIAAARKNSSYWGATEAWSPYMAAFFLNPKTTAPHLLKDAPGGSNYLTEGPDQLTRGKVVFAERCARCHSSKLPPLPAGLDLENCNGRNYLTCWSQYWEWTKSDAFKAPMRQIAAAVDFTTDNYLSTELRVPSTLLQTNYCSPLATNAIGGNIWDNFSSQSYKELPPVGTVKVRHPVTGAESDYTLAGGGRGYTRPASLVSAWSTAPFLQNNTVGHFNPSPSVDARMRVFQDSIEQMLWPERRDKDRIFERDNGPGVGIIDRTTSESAIWIPAGFIPDELRPLLGISQRLFPFLFRNGSLEFGPIPANFPVGLISNIDLDVSAMSVPARHEQIKTFIKLLDQARHDLVHNRDLYTDPKLVDTMLALSKCPDLVVNKGHYFGTSYFTEEPGLSDEDKRALIGFIKTF